MNTTSRTMTAIALAVGSAVLAACGTADSAETPAQGSPAGADRPTGQHVHDSWNPCHLGENVPTSMEDQGPHCYDRLRPATGR
jgi:hypothetical protein